MIKPTVGRIVWFWPSLNTDPSFSFHDASQPCAAQIAYVWGDRMVNLSVLDQNGAQHTRTSVPLLQEGDAISGGGYYCTWMPYQVGQARTQAGT